MFGLTTRLRKDGVLVAEQHPALRVANLLVFAAVAAAAAFSGGPSPAAIAVCALALFLALWHERFEFDPRAREVRQSSGIGPLAGRRSLPLGPSSRVLLDSFLKGSPATGEELRSRIASMEASDRLVERAALRRVVCRLVVESPEGRVIVDSAPRADMKRLIALAEKVAGATGLPVTRT